MLGRIIFLLCGLSSPLAVGHRPAKIIKTLSFTLIRKYSQQLITNADRQGANRELITFNSGRLSVFLSSLCYAIERHF